jgi:Fic family protein
MHRFDYQFLAVSLPANLLEIAGIIYDLRGKSEIRKMNNLHLFQELQHTATVDSIQSSNAIEGIVTTAERVKKLVNKQSEPFTHDEQEILGYRDVLDEIYNH